MRLPSLVLVGAIVTGCADPEPSVGDAPLPPGKDDAPGYMVTGARGWYLVGNDLTPGDDELALTIKAPAATTRVDLFIDGQFVKRATLQAGTFRFSIALDDVAIGTHEILLSTPGATTAFAERTFHRSHPLYVAVSNDWDDPDNEDATLERQERLHARHPNLVLTHFVGPYTFTEGISLARQQRLVEWVKNLAATEGDEIGLHVHPYCSFIRAAGVTCRTSPSFAYATGDTTGYTVRIGAYTKPELEKIFAKAKSLFVANGLPAPTSFRAGGWTAEPHVLAALATAGHVADSSGCNWSRLEEWEHQSGASLYAWNKDNWASIDETSQPYYPAEDDILADRAPHLPVLEVPDNGLLVDYVSGAEMIEMFRANYKGDALAEPTVYAIGYHPPNFSEAYFQRMDTALAEIDKHLIADGTGPVIYARMSDLPRAFPRQ